MAVIPTATTTMSEVSADTTAMSAVQTDTKVIKTKCFI